MYYYYNYYNKYFVNKNKEKKKHLAIFLVCLFVRHKNIFCQNHFGAWKFHFYLYVCAAVVSSIGDDWHDARDMLFATLNTLCAYNI